MDKTLVGVFNGARDLSDVIEVINDLKLRKGTVVGVEYSLHHFYKNSLTVQDYFWKGLINYLQKEKKCKIVFLDSEQLRTQIDSSMAKEKKISLATAKKMYGREKEFMQGIPECEVSFLGAEHAIRLHKKAKARLALDSPSFIMNKLGLLALTPEQRADPNFFNKKRRILRRLDRKKSLFEIAGLEISDVKKRKKFKNRPKKRPK